MYGINCILYENSQAKLFLHWTYKTYFFYLNGYLNTNYYDAEPFFLYVGNIKYICK